MHGFWNRSKFGFFETWSEASGDVWDGQGWCKTCLYWSPLMFGSVWECLMLIWDNFPLTHLPPTSQQTILPWPDIMIGTKPALHLGSAIFHLLLCHLLPQTCPSIKYLRKNAKQVKSGSCQLSLGGSKSLDRFQKKSKYWIFWTSVRGVWDGFGW